MKRLFGAIAVLAIIGGGAYGGWIYAGKPDLLAMLQGEDGETPSATTKVRSAEFAALTAKYTDILEQDFVLEGGGETSAEDVAALLPDAIRLTIGTSTFDAASGATVWSDVSLTGAENASVGVTAEGVKLWGLNTDGIAARVAGTNLDETVKLAERIEAIGVKTLGFETLFADVMVGYIEGVSNTVETIAPEEGLTEDDLAELRSAMDMVINEYAFDVGRIVAVGPQMRPWELSLIDIEAAVESEDESQAALLIFQEAVAYYRTFGVDHLIWEDTKFSMTMEQEGIKQDASGGYEFVAYSGWYGGDIESSVMAGLHMQQIVDMSEAFADLEPLSAEPSNEAFQQMNMDIGIHSASLSGMKLDKALRYVAMGEWPPTTDTDLMAYGRLDMQDMDVALNGSSIASVDKILFDLSEWHWFIPSKAEISVTGLAYKFDELINLIGAGFGPGNQEELAQMEAIISVLRQYEALPFVYDTTLIWDWSPDTGAFSLSSPQKHHKFGAANFEIAGTLPNFEQGVAAVKADLAYEPEPDADIWDAHFRETAWDKLIEETFAVSKGQLVLEDQGGLDKIFALMVEVGKLNPDEAGPMLANSTPEALRNMAVSSIGMGAFEAGKELPRAEAWMMSFADWVRDGGTITLRLEPPRPLGSWLEKENPDPEEIAEILGLSVVHETP